jgi:hypothetical protein
MAIPDSSHSKTTPSRLRHTLNLLAGDRNAHFIFSPCGNYLWTNNHYPIGEHCIELSKYQLLSAPLSSRSLPRLVNRAVYVDPLPECTSVFIIKDGEPHFLRRIWRSPKTNIILFHVAFDGTVRWKTIGSRPTQAMNQSMELAGWDVKKKGGRIDIVLTGGGFGNEVVVVTTWEGEN